VLVSTRADFVRLLRTFPSVSSLLRSFFRHGSNGLLAAGAALCLAAAATGRVKLRYRTIGVGTLLFFLSEYGAHRFLLHAKPAPWPFVRRLQHRLHYDHHVEPTRLDLLFLPPWALFPTLGLFATLYAALTRNRGTVVSLVLGNLIGLFYYEWVHYVAHVPLQPLTPYGRWIKKYHLWHHFKNEKLWFGVTNPAMDVLHRTYVDVAEADRSGTTRVLYS